MVAPAVAVKPNAEHLAPALLPQNGAHVRVSLRRGARRTNRDPSENLHGSILPEYRVVWRERPVTVRQPCPCPNLPRCWSVAIGRGIKRSGHDAEPADDAWHEGQAGLGLAELPVHDRYGVGVEVGGDVSLEQAAVREAGSQVFIERLRIGWVGLGSRFRRGEIDLQ